jgi:hypothetical protein
MVLKSLKLLLSIFSILKVCSFLAALFLSGAYNKHLVALDFYQWFLSVACTNNLKLVETHDFIVEVLIGGIDYPKY